MSEAARHILEEALRLPSRERAEVAAQLLRTLDDDAFGAPEAGYEEAWTAEIERRVRDLDEGRAGLVDADQALAALRHKFTRK